jgi:hypothetical protein
MSLKLRRRSVYLVTGVAILAMVAGFAMATGAFLGFGGTSVNGNQGAISTGNTVYSPGVSGSQFTTGSAGTGLLAGDCGATATASGTPLVALAWVSGGPGSCANTQDYVLQLNFTSGSLTAGTYTDLFTVSSEFGATTTTYTTQSVTVVCAPTSSATCQADISIDTGVPVSDPQPAVLAVDISVTGS